MQKRIIAAALCLTFIIMTFTVGTTAFAAEFSDVPITASYYKAVDKLSNDGVIQGRGDNTFAPNDNTTRAEFCAFLARANNYTSSYSASSLPFIDVQKGNWAEGYISFCYNNGYVNGMIDGTFAPNDNITCEQAVKMVVCASGVGDESLSKIGPKWYSGYINVARKNNLLDGANLEISEPANRAFVAQIVYNSMLVSGKNKTADAVDLGKDNTSSDIQSTGMVIASEDIWEPETQEELERVIREHERGYYDNEDDYLADQQASENTYTLPDNNNSYDYTPVGSSDGMLVVIDSGHNYSGVDTGAVGNGLREQDITYYIAEKLKPILERNGFTVVMTRNSLKENVSTESVSASLKRRAEIANRAGADLFISIHCNAGGGTGTETYYCTGSESGKVFAGFVQNGLIDAVGLRNRGVKSARYSVLKNTDMTSILVETGFIDNANDAAYLGSDLYREAFAEGIARGVCDYIGVDFN